MIKNIFYVEDGSVDVDQLNQILDKDSHIITYRQGSTPPVLVQPERYIGVEGDNRKFAEQAKKLQDGIKSIIKSAGYHSYEYDLHVDLISFLEDIIKEFGSNS